MKANTPAEMYTLVHRDHPHEMVPPLDDSGVINDDDPGMVFRTRMCAESVAQCQKELYALEVEVITLEQLFENIRARARA